VGKTLSFAASAMLAVLLDDGPVFILCPAPLMLQWQVELKDKLGIPSAVWLSVKNTCAEAEQAGFRPCKRCRPHESALAAQHTATVAQACRLIETAETMPNLEALAAAAGMSRFHFHRVFKLVTDVTPKAYTAAHQARLMREKLGHSATVTEAIYGAGSLYWCTRRLRRRYRPTWYRCLDACSSIENPIPGRA